VFVNFIKRSALASLLATFLIITVTIPVNSADIKLPSLGDSTSGIISQQQEHELGRAWLMAYRSRINEHHDPFLSDYLEQLLYKLVSHSELEDRRLELITINNPSMNAFAVPGGVIGIHTGLFRYAKSEHQLSSVLAHEIAHLSQRHFARRVEAQRKNTAATLAGMLASLVLAATVGGDAGLAGLTASQAASQQSSLNYSRQNEQEADRLGLKTMVSAGMDPRAMSAMFEEMLRITRYTGSRPPEFLLTHPLTENRVADARNRINQLPPRQYLDNLEFHLMRARALIAIDNNASVSLNRFQHELQGNTLNSQAARYGVVLSYIALGNYTKAKESLKLLLQKSPNNLTYQMADIDLDRAQKKYDRAISKTKKLLAYRSDSYPLRISLAESYLKANRYLESEQMLDTLTLSHPNSPEVWFQLAEVRGLAGNISGVHQARARYFILNGVFDQARDQLGYARKLLVNDFKQTAIIDQQLRDLAKLEEKLESF
jgi:predicted Zn-dependent protease